MSEWNVGLAMPEWILAVAMMVALVKDARSPVDRKEGVARTTWWGLLLATLWVAFQGLGIDAGSREYAFRGAYGLDAFSVVFKMIFGITALFVHVLSTTWLRRVDRGHAEFHILSLFATMGMFFAASAEDFAGLFVALELVTVSFYCLTAFKRNDQKSVESAVKYVILGALASAFLLLGIAFIYGATGSLLLRDLATATQQNLGDSSAALLQFGILLTVVGLGFKIAAVPFQVWTPDVYEGASSPVTAFLSMGSKAAGFVLLLKVARACIGPAADSGLAISAPWLTIFALMASATILYGNLGAMWQGNLKRLLGFSSIGHAGYLLMGLFAFSQDGFTAILYYLMAYLFTVMGVFAVIVVVNAVTRSHEIECYDGLGRRSPFLALVLTCGMLSLAGVPPMAGFYGKFLVFRAVVAKGTGLAYLLAFVGAAGVVISLYYYLCVVKRIYMHEPHEVEGSEPIPVSRGIKAVLFVCVAGMFILGIFMRPFHELAESAASALTAVP